MSAENGAGQNGGEKRKLEEDDETARFVQIFKT